LYLHSVYNSSAMTYYAGVYNWAVTFSGQTALRYVDEDGQPGGPSLTFRDPTFDIMSDAREIAFRTAVYAAMDSELVQWDDKQTIQAQQLWSQIVYKSQYIYLTVAVSLTVLAALSVSILLLGWWKLGRDVTLSPVEIAKAFAAPSLHDANSNATIGALLKTTGYRRLRYGAVWHNAGVDERSEATAQFERDGKCEKPQEGQALQ
jgi:hypothetical protein